jgi:alkylation response protein AidB-like acyl-CoA dehydrogenase
MSERGTAPSLDEFRREVADFLAAHAQPRRRDGGEPRPWGEGDDRVSLPVVSALSDDEEQALLGAAKAFQSALFDASLAWISGPADLGGRELPGAYERVFAEMASEYVVADRSQLRTGTRIIAPSVWGFADPALSRELLPRVLRGDAVACQLFSEPDAGSDLANVQTRAVRDGDVWRLTGQKVWSSGAHLADVGACLARTSNDGAKHHGLTMFVIDLDVEGVEVRPIPQMTGGSEFDEVFLEDVVVPDRRRVGDVGAGWAVALHMLMNERSAIGDELVPDQLVTDRLIGMCRAFDAPPDLRLAAADVLARMMTTRWMVDGILGAQEDGVPPGPELAAAKLAITDDVTRVSELVTELLGARLTADTGEWGTFAWTEFVLGVHGLRVGGGTDEVLLNTIGERVLGLPREPRPSA